MRLTSMRPVERRVYLQELEIRARLKSIHPILTFSMRGVAARNESARMLLHGHGIATASALAKGFDELSGRHRSSSACAYEKFRARLWVNAILKREFRGPDEALFFVTLADRRHVCPATRLLQFSPERAKYAVLKAFAKIRRIIPECKLVGVVEVSASRLGRQFVFEPHVHVIIAGASKELLRSHLPRSPHYDRQIGKITDLAKAGAYISKFKPEFRSRYRNPNGRPRRRRNKMKAAQHAAWLEWHAKYGISDLLFTRGFLSDFRQAELNELLDSLVGRFHEHPHPGPRRHR